jgi:cytochrome c oxidase subunit 2
VFPESDSGRIIQNVYGLVTWIDLGIFVVVAALLTFALVRYHARKGQEMEIPKQVHGNLGMELVWTIIPAVILIFIAVPTWSGIFRQANLPTDNVVKVKAIGHQWWWEFDLPEQGIVTANTLYLPVNRPVVVETTSVDVIHSFWVPRLAGKIDSLPGKVNTVWFTTEQPGLYFGQCAEFCGTSHANMRFRVKVVSQEEFDSWVAHHKQPPQPQDDAAKDGETLFVQKGCIACHAITGVPVAVGVLGPNLTDLKERVGLAAAIIENTPEDLARWIKDPQAVKPGALMGLKQEDGSYKPIPVTDEEAVRLAAYLLSPTGAPAAQPAAAAEAPSTSAKAEAPAAENKEALTKAVTQIIGKYGCGACHTIPGIPNAVGTLAPSWKGFADRPKIAGGKLDNTPENIRAWLHDPKAVKSDTIMPKVPLTEAEVNDLVTFLETLR